MSTESRYYDPALAVTAVFAFAWAVIRAVAQAVTIDEADTYLAWAGGDAGGHWYPASNNHVLNSMLIRLFTSSFGLSPVTVRTPALIGALV